MDLPAYRGYQAVFFRKCVYECDAQNSGNGHGGGWEIWEGLSTLELLPAATRQELLGRTRYWKKLFD
jgi:hypothetical protein